jgi:hypothetical protein
MHRVLLSNPVERIGRCVRCVPLNQYDETGAMVSGTGMWMIFGGTAVDAAAMQFQISIQMHRIAVNE